MSEQEEKQENIYLEKLKDELQRWNYQYEMQLGQGSFSPVIQAKHLPKDKGKSKDEGENKYAIKILPIVYGETGGTDDEN